MANFDQAFQELMDNEVGNAPNGGYVNNPHDPGGETKWGVTKRVAVANGYTGAMIDLSEDKAKEIAKAQYWDKYYCDQLPQDAAFQVFDGVYNSEPTAVIDWLQHAANVARDGNIGPATIQAVNAMDQDKFILRFDAYRLLWLTHLDNWKYFSTGWARRVANNMLKAAE